MFTANQIEEIRKKLSAIGIKDTELPITKELNGNETMAIVQEGQNKQVPFSEIIGRIMDNVICYVKQEIDKILPPDGFDWVLCKKPMSMEGYQYIVYKRDEDGKLVPVMTSDTYPIVKIEAIEDSDSEESE